jgi:hypothetical protein
MTPKNTAAQWYATATAVLARYSRVLELTKFKLMARYMTAAHTSGKSQKTVYTRIKTISMCVCMYVFPNLWHAV